jgi:hypothetical protein
LISVSVRRHWRRRTRTRERKEVYQKLLGLGLCWMKGGREHTLPLHFVVIMSNRCRRCAVETILHLIHRFSLLIALLLLLLLPYAPTSCTTRHIHPPKSSTISSPYLSCPPSHRLRPPPCRQARTGVHGQAESSKKYTHTHTHTHAHGCASAQAEALTRKAARTRYSLQRGNFPPCF